MRKVSDSQTSLRIASLCGLAALMVLPSCGQTESDAIAQLSPSAESSVAKIRFSKDKETRLALGGTGSKMLLIDSENRLQIQEPTGTTYLMAQGGKRKILFTFSDLEKVKLVKPDADYWRPSESVVWKVSQNQVSTLFYDPQNKVWRQFESILDASAASAPLKPLAFTERGFLANRGSKVIRFAFSDNRLTSASFEWPLPSEPIVTGGLDPETNFAWGLTGKSLVQWNFENGKWKIFLLKKDSLHMKDLKVGAWASRASQYSTKKDLELKPFAALVGEDLFVNGVNLVAPDATSVVIAESVFDSKVKPLAEKHCENCHSPVSVRKFKETLKETSWTGALKARIVEEIESDNMPKDGKLEPAEKKVLLDYLKSLP